MPTKQSLNFWFWHQSPSTNDPAEQGLQSGWRGRWAHENRCQPSNRFHLGPQGLSSDASREGFPLLPLTCPNLSSPTTLVFIIIKATRHLLKNCWKSTPWEKVHRWSNWSLWLPSPTFLTQLSILQKVLSLRLMHLVPTALQGVGRTWSAVWTLMVQPEWRGHSSTFTTSSVGWGYGTHICPLDAGAGPGDHQTALSSSPCLLGPQEGLGPAWVISLLGRSLLETTTAPALSDEPALCDVD